MHGTMNVKKSNMELKCAHGTQSVFAASEAGKRTGT